MSRSLESQGEQKIIKIKIYSDEEREKKKEKQNPETT